MLLRFIAENIASFKDSVEFNTFPSSKSHSHENHKVSCDHATALRMSALYGANGAGKSNLLVLMSLIQTLVCRDDMMFSIKNRAFMFDKELVSKPSGVAIEFYNEGHVYYYHIEFNDEMVLVEELYLSQKSRDAKIFARNGEDIELNGDFVPKGYNQQFTDALHRIVRPDLLLLSFMGKYYPQEMPLVTSAYRWFADKLHILRPDSYAKVVPHLLDTDHALADLADSIVPELNTGISRLAVRKEVIGDSDIKGNLPLERAIAKAKQNPGVPQDVSKITDEIANVVCEDGVVYLKTLLAIHKSEGVEVEMDLSSESDGTRRLIDYLPLFYDVVKNDKVYVVDEIESSIHPILIKSLVSKLSHAENAHGQLIFSTHESALLDQDIFRADEIWFAQKDSEQATQLYPLSDYNIHKTANIENGYLGGRYGGIPFLSNLNDLHW